MPAVSRISSIHCWLSTSTCCEREKQQQQQQNKGSVTPVMQGFNFRSNARKWRTGDEGKVEKWINRERWRQTELLPLGDTHLSVRVFYCGVVLFHKDPLNELDRLRGEDRDKQQVSGGSDQRGGGKMARGRVNV